MIIECPHCESKVDGKILGEHISYDEENPFPFKVLLLECPVCNEALLGCQELIQVGPDEDVWITGERLWPRPRSYISSLLPSIVRDDLEEAQKCYNAKAYNACAVMCGRVLEGICKIHNPNNKTIVQGLKDLLERKVIDERLFQWGEALRKQRNLGAHANEAKISKEDAHDLLDFANAICNYIFVLSEQFKKYIKRQERRVESP